MELNPDVAFNQIERGVGVVSDEILQLPGKLVLVIVVGGIIIGNHVPRASHVPDNRSMHPPKNIILDQCPGHFEPQFQSVIVSTGTVVKAIMEKAVPDFATEAPPHLDVVAVGKIALDV